MWNSTPGVQVYTYNDSDFIVIFTIFDVTGKQ